MSAEDYFALSTNSLVHVFARSILAALTIVSISNRYGSAGRPEHRYRWAAKMPEGAGA